MQLIGTLTKRKIYPYAEIHRGRGKLIICLHSQYSLNEFKINVSIKRETTWKKFFRKYICDIDEKSTRNSNIFLI